MDYYRHCFNYKDIRENLLNTVADFGFVEKSTREPYYGALAKGEGNIHKTLCWKNDLLADTSIYVYIGSVENNQSCGLMFYRSYTDGNNIPGWNRDTSWTFSSILGMTNSPSLGQTYTVDNHNYYNQSIIIIPLINGGFLYNINFLPDNVQYASYPLNPTPKLNIIGDKDTTLYYTLNRTVIGVPNTLNTNLNNYLYFGLACCSTTPNEDPNYKYFLTDYQQGRALDYIPFINTNSTDYTDLNNNICTLIKMPYDNGYLDNVYMMATRPGDLTKEGSFFSFAGRNFINVYKNLVLELPS